MAKLLVAAAALGAALLAQLTIVNGLPLPGGAVPDLVLACVVATGLTAGPRAGLLAGFCTGLAVDLAPPDTGLLGVYALAFCLVGYLCGRLRSVTLASAGLAMLTAACAMAAGEVLVACLTLALDTPGPTLASVAAGLPWSVLYDAMASPVVLLVWVRAAALLGASFSPVDDTPAVEAGGSAAPSAVAAVRRGALGASQRPAGRWLVGDGAEEAAAVGAVGWLDGPPRSRRARRDLARLTATLTGASPRAGAFWVGSRPPGLVTAPPAAGPGQSGLARLHPDAGTAGSAAPVGGPAPGPWPAKPVRLGLASEQRRRARSRRGPAWAAARHGDGGQHGPDRHGVRGPGLPSIPFGAGGQAGQGDALWRRVTGRPRAAGTQPGRPRPAGHGVPRIAFGSRADLAVPHRTSPGRPAAPRFRAALARSASGPWLARSATASGRTARFGSAGGLGHGPGAVRPAGGARLSARGLRAASITRGTASRRGRPPRVKTARMSSRRRSLGWLPGLRRAGDRSTVWRIGSARTSSAGAIRAMTRSARAEGKP